MSETSHRADRSLWRRGPWDDEHEDRVDFLRAAFACFIQRGFAGVWCGYVGVPAEHPCYGVHYDDVDVEVHGGLTYAARCSGSICHGPLPGMPDDVWWLGFDTGHAGDRIPTSDVDEWPESYQPTYRDRAYATAETERLADQLAKLAAEPQSSASLAQVTGRPLS